MTQAEKDAEAGKVGTVDPLVSQVVEAIKTGGWNRDIAARIIAMVREHDAKPKTTYDIIGVTGAILVLEAILARYEKTHYGQMSVQDIQDHFRTMKTDVETALKFCKAHDAKQKAGE
jgi:hypothetical protein